MYLIIRHGFDSMENHNPEYRKIEGYVKTEEQAKKIVNGFNKSENFIENSKVYPRFKSNYSSLYYNGLYPYLSYKKVEEIKLK